MMPLVSVPTRRELPPRPWQGVISLGEREHDLLLETRGLDPGKNLAGGVWSAGTQSYDLVAVPVPTKSASALIGPKRVGHKTTFLKCPRHHRNLRAPQRGSCTFDGADITPRLVARGPYHAGHFPSHISALRRLSPPLPFCPIFDNIMSGNHNAQQGLLVSNLIRALSSQARFRGYRDRGFAPRKLGFRDFLAL